MVSRLRSNKTSNGNFEMENAHFYSCHVFVPTRHQLYEKMAEYFSFSTCKRCDGFSIDEHYDWRYDEPDSKSICGSRCAGR